MASPIQLPNIIANDETKDSQKYGLDFMRSVFERWRVGAAESAVDRKARYDYNRSYAFGKQDMNEFKDILDLDGEMSVINLAIDPLAIAPAFINRLKDRLIQRNEKITCTSIDPLSQTKREKAYNDALFKMKEKEKIQAVQQQAGVPLEEFSEDDPQSKHELEIQFGFTYKEREEVLMEQLIDLVFYDNDWSDVIKDRILTDLINCGISMIVPYIDANGRIKLIFELPENIISSYCIFDDLRDYEYMGRVTQMSISDVRLLYPGKISEENLYKLAFSQKGINGNPNEWQWNWDLMFNYAIARPYDRFTVTVVELAVKTLYGLKYKEWDDKYGTSKLTKVTWDSDEEEGVNYEKSPPYEVNYFGRYIADTSYLLEWGLSKNMIRPEDNVTQIKSPYVVYMYGNNQMVNTPMVEMMIPSIKIMQLTWLQQQKIIAAAAPDGFDVDISMMSDSMNLGQGLNNVSPFDAYKIYKQIGINYYKRSSDDGEEKNRQPPIQPKNVPFSGKLEQLMNVWNSEYDKLQRIVGSNNAAEGQFTNQAIGKQVVQDAKQISESSSNYIWYAYLNMRKNCAKHVQQLGWNILVYGKKEGIRYYDGYRKALGTGRVEYLRIEGDEDFERMQFDVQVEAVIDDNEAALLEANIQECLKNQSITLADAIDVRELAKTNIKYASYMLAYRQKKQQEVEQKAALANSQANTDQQIAAAQAASQGQMQLEQLKSQLAAQAKEQELEQLQIAENVKYTSIMKVELMKAILSQEGKTVNDLPPIIFDGVNLVDASNKQLLLEQLQEEAMQQQQMQQAQQQQENPQEQMSDKGQPEQQPEDAEQQQMLQQPQL